MIYVLLVIMIHFVAAFIVTTCALKPLRNSDLPVMCMLVSITSFYGLPVLLGTATGYLNTITLIISAVIASLAALMSFKHGNVANSPLANLKAILKQLSPTAWVFSIVIFCYLAIAFIAGTILPVRAWDAAAYHIIGPVRWAQSGKFMLDSFGDPFAYPYLAAGEVYPNAKGILPFMIMLWRGSDAGTALTQWPYLCLLAAALYGLYRRMDLTPAMSLFCILFSLTVPEVMLQSVEAYADIAYFAGVVCVMWACIISWQDKVSMSSIVCGAMAFGILAGTKTTAYLSCAVMGPVYLIIVYLRQQTGRQVIARKITYVGVALASVLAFAFLMAGPWFIHGIIKLKNPVYPMDVTVLGKTIFDGPYPPSMNSDFVLNHTKRSGYNAWWGMITEQWRPPTIASWSGGLGVAAFVIGMPCTIAYLLIAWLKPGRTETLIIFILMLLLIVSCPALVLARFVLFTLAFAGLAVGTVLAYLHYSVRLLVGVVAVLLFSYNVYVTAPSVLYRYRPASLVSFDLISGYTRTAKDDKFPDEYGAIDYWLDAVAAPDTKLAITDDITVWHAFSPNSAPDVVRVLESPDQPFQEWLDQAKTKGATHAYLLRSSPHFKSAAGNSDQLELLYWNIHKRLNRAAFMPDIPEAALFRIRALQR